MRARHPHITLAALGTALALFASGCTFSDRTDDGLETAAVSSPTASDSAGESPGAEKSRVEQIRDAGKLRVCTTGDYPPFTEETEDGELKGIDVDMARDLAETLGVEAEFVTTSWGDLMDDFLGKCDVAVGGISMNPKRAEQVYFSEKTLEDGKTPIARCEDVDKYRSIEDINQPGVRSIFPEGGTNEEFAREHYPDGELITHDNLTIFDALAAGEADVMTTDRAEVLYTDHEYDELCAVNPDEPFDYSVQGYMLPQGDDVFKHYVDQWLMVTLEDGTYDGFAEPWVGEADLNPED
ncbi:transporter substrate-binding domain-containing protein [Micrococcus luteus]